MSAPFASNEIELNGLRLVCDAIDFLRGIPKHLRLAVRPYFTDARSFVRSHGRIVLLFAHFDKAAVHQSPRQSVF